MYDLARFLTSESWIEGLVLLVDSVSMPVVRDGPVLIPPRTRVIPFGPSRSVPETVLIALTHFLVVVSGIVV